MQPPPTKTTSMAKEKAWWDTWEKDSPFYVRLIGTPLLRVVGFAADLLAVGLWFVAAAAVVVFFLELGVSWRNLTVFGWSDAKTAAAGTALSVGLAFFFDSVAHRLREDIRDHGTRQFDAKWAPSLLLVMVVAVPVAFRLLHG